MNLSEKSAYLKGLMDGLKLDQLLQEATGAIGDLQENAEAVSDELDEIEDDLDAIEDYLMDDDDEEDGFMDDDGEDFDYDDDTMYEVTCPKCGEGLHLDEVTLLNDSVDCPKCGEPLEFEFDEDDGL